MKKFIVLTLTIMAFAVADAQLLNTKPIAQPVRMRSTKTIVPVARPLAAQPEAVTLDGELTLMDGPRCAAAMPNTYYGVGISKDNQQVTWTMTVTKDDAGVYTFSNIGPVPASWASIVSEFVVTGTEKNGKVIVEPQPTQLQSASYDVWFCNYGSSATRARIEFTINEDGSLTIDPGTVLCYFGVKHGEQFDPTFADRTVMLGYVYYFGNVSYTFDAPVLEASAAFEPDAMYLHVSYGYIGYGLDRNYCIIPAFATIPMKNYSMYADTYEWSVDEIAFNFYTNDYDYIVDTITGDEENFEFTTLGGKMYGAVTLEAANDNNSSAYTWGTQFDTKRVVAYAGELATYFNFYDGSQPIMGRGNPDFGLAFNENFATPDLSTNNISELILYQGKCVAPLFCEGINMLVHKFEKKSGFNLKCSLYKATRDANGRLTLGDLIAESSKVTSYQAGANMENFAEIRWTDFSVRGRYGQMVKRDHLFIEDEFAIVISGWNNGTFSAIPFSESHQNENGLPSTFVRLNGQDAIMSYSTNYRKMYVGFFNAVYGYLLSPGGTDVMFPAEGGGVATTIYPFLTNGNYENAYTRIYRDEEYTVPEWLTFGIMNESYEDDEDMHFDLAFVADPLPEGVDRRSCEILLWQEGAKLLFTITQDRNYEVGVGTVSATPAVNSPVYNLAGQRITTRQRGLTIQDGKKIIR